ncbi:MAG: CPBP family intramembrane metalloprotease [Anaerolineae bacterium]|nr:CPBP family intramembrane metalloprotease [Anaerolineae bacterium]
MTLGTSPTVIAVACIAGLGSLFFAVAFLVDWIRSWSHVKAYWAYGLGAALATLAFVVAGALAGILSAAQLLAESAPRGWESAPGSTGEDVLAVLLLGVLLLVLGLVVLFIATTMLAGVTMLGMHYADVLGLPGFALRRRRKTTPLAAAPAASDRAIALPVATADTPVLTPLPAGGVMAAACPRPRCDYILSTLGVAAAAVGYSAALFRLVPPRLSEALSGLSGNPEASAALTLQVLVTVLAAAFSEEIFYRLGVQNFLARYLGCRGAKYWIPIALTSLLWTLGHAGVLEPAWLKLAQIFPIGLVLGWLYRWHGVESCMLAHALFNIVLAALAPSLARV